MAHSTSCPACGAPIEYSGEHDVVHCTFCETDIEVFEENNETRFRVLAHTEPQELHTDEQVDRWNPDQGPQPQDPDEPIAPGYATTGSSMADPNAWSPQAVIPGIPETADSIPDAQAHYTLRRDEPPVPATSQGNRNRWIGIGLAVFIVGCIMCACIVSIPLAASWFRVNF
jgi:hypothetical protein